MAAIPKTPRGWITEIRAAQLDAAEAIPFGPLVGVDISADELFHLAPMTALKFRGLPISRRNLKRATDAALSTYIATISESPAFKSFPTVCFALAYLASHYGLDLISREQVKAVMDDILESPGQLLAPTRRPRTSVARPGLPIGLARLQGARPRPTSPKRRARKAT